MIMPVIPVLLLLPMAVTASPTIPNLWTKPFVNSQLNTKPTQRGSTRLSTKDSAMELNTVAAAGPQDSINIPPSPHRFQLPSIGILGVLVGALYYFARVLPKEPLPEVAMASSSGDAEGRGALIEVGDGETAAAAESQAAWLLRYGIGDFCFQLQFWLTIVSVAVGVFAGQWAYSGAGTVIGLGFTAIAAAASVVSVLWTKRCRTVGQTIRQEIKPKDGRIPSKGDVVKLLWSGILINLQGLFALIIGLEANTGMLFSASLTAGPTMMVPGYGRGISAFDVYAQLAQAQCLLSLIAGLAIALHTLRVVTRPFAKKASAV